MQWFRMYSEFATDPVVQCLSFDDQRHFVMVLCLKASGLLDKEFVTPQKRVEMLKRVIGLDANAFEEARNRLSESGLIDTEWQPTNWNKRQFISDRDPTAIKRKQKQRERERHAHVTRDSHVGVTVVSRPSESESESDTEQKQSKRARPKRASRVPADFVPDLALARAQLPGVDAEREAQKFRDWEFKTPRSDWAAVWRSWVGQCRDSGRYAKSNGRGEWL